MVLKSFNLACLALKSPLSLVQSQTNESAVHAELRWHLFQASFLNLPGILTD